MDRMEHEIFQSDHPLLTYVALWRRYVDDVLCVWTGPNELLQPFLDFINSIYPTIEFTMEVGGTRINFLDLTINIEENKYTFNIYRKPTATDATIHGSSLCPISHKIAAYNYYIHRLVSLPLTPEAITNETQLIKHLAKVNKIRIDIDGLIRRKMVGTTLNKTTTFKRTPLIRENIGSSGCPTFLGLHLISVK